VNTQLVQGSQDIASKKERALAHAQIYKFKVQTKKYELEESLRLMLKDDMISKRDYDHKLS
jgi:hypothetical protein